jgi:hypothetical protein
MASVVCTGGRNGRWITPPEIRVVRPDDTFERRSWTASLKQYKVPLSIRHQEPAHRRLARRTEPFQLCVATFGHRINNGNVCTNMHGDRD